MQNRQLWFIAVLVFLVTNSVFGDAFDEIGNLEEMHYQGDDN